MMTHLMKERKFSSYRELMKTRKHDTFIDVVYLDNINVDTINYILTKWSADKDLNEYSSTVKHLEIEVKEKTEALKQIKRN
jgi:hypothetical protein